MRFNLLKRVLIAILLLAVWEFTATEIPFMRLLISKPTLLATFIANQWWPLLGDIWHTALSSIIGLSVAIISGGGLGLLGALSTRIGKRMTALATLTQSVPLIVFVPFAVITFGVGWVSQILLASIMAIFPLVISVITSSERARGEYEELAVLYNLGAAERVIELYIPYMMPNIISTIRICASLAILGAVIAEFTGSPQGLGRNIFLGTVRIDPELMMASLGLTLGLSVLVHIVFSYAERRASWWLE